MSDPSIRPGSTGPGSTTSRPTSSAGSTPSVRREGRIDPTDRADIADRIDRRMDREHVDHRCPIQTAALIVGALFVLAGIAGFIPGITDNASDIEFAGNDSPSELFGVFQVSVLHNLVHLLFGVAGLAAARRATASRWYLVGGGAIYLLLVIYGLVVDETSDANFIPLNDADDWLHLGLGLAMILLGAALWRHRTHDAYTSRSTARF